MMIFYLINTFVFSDFFPPFSLQCSAGWPFKPHVRSSCVSAIWVVSKKPKRKRKKENETKEMSDGPIMM